MLSEKDSVNRPCYCKQPVFFLPLLLKLLKSWYLALLILLHVCPYTSSVFFIHSKLIRHQNSFKVNALEHLFILIFILFAITKTDKSHSKNCYLLQKLYHHTLKSLPSNRKVRRDCTVFYHIPRKISKLVRKSKVHK